MVCACATHLVLRSVFNLVAAAQSPACAFTSCTGLCVRNYLVFRSVFNLVGKIGGNAGLSDKGREYAFLLPEVIMSRLPVVRLQPPRARLPVCLPAAALSPGSVRVGARVCLLAAMPQPRARTQGRVAASARQP